MTEKKKESGMMGGDYESEDVFADAEPWSPVETKLVVWSFVAALFFLVVFGVLVNIYIV